MDVFISLGEPLILVSDLEGLYFGMTVGEATGELDAAGFGVVGETLVNDEVVPAGNVIGLDVAEGVYELEAGSDVMLLVSDGPADRRVPAVPESREPRARRRRTGGTPAGAASRDGVLGRRARGKRDRLPPGQRQCGADRKHGAGQGLARAHAAAGA